MSDSTTADRADPTLETRLGRLEEILARMESDDVELEEALTLFEEGVQHVRAAETLLSATELKVEELLASGATQPLDLDDA
ncbi:MAG: exodeoxyribonuclease VII small subunit [Gemmatimonadota bacterium]